MTTIDNDIFEKFKEIAKRLVMIRKEVRSSLKINSTYHKVLSILHIKSGLTQSCLGEFCDMDRPAISRLVGKMEKDNLVSRNLKQGNKKNLYISLTEKGKSVANLIYKKMEEIRAKFFGNLQEKDKVTFAKLLDKSLIDIYKEELC